SDAEVDNLPYDENFDGQSADDFTVINGDFTFVLDDPGNEPTTSSFSGSAFDVSWSTESVSGLAQRNLAIWSSGIPEQNDWTTVFKRVEVGLYMDTGPAGCLHNGGIVFNHKDLSGSDSYVHWTAELD